VGLIPAVLLFSAGAGGGVPSVGYPSHPDIMINFLMLGGIVYVVELVVTIICLVTKSSRLFGYGLSTGMLISPVVAVMSCAVILWQH
jgi:hypothetical protein